MEAVDGETLFVGGKGAVDDLEDLDFILNLSFSCDAAYTSDVSYAHLPLRDDHHCEYRDFVQACDLLKARYGSDEKILVHCQSGQSRSVAVTSTVLSSIRGEEFRQMLLQVQECLGLSRDPEPTLVAYGNLYLQE